MPTSSSSISGEELSELKESVLKATLNNKPLPGSNQPLAFPDLPFILTQPGIYVVDHDIKHSIPLEEIHKTVQVLSEDVLPEKAGESGKVIYFQFRTANQEKDNLSLTLEAKTFFSADRRKQILTSVQMQFKRLGNEWKIVDDPISLSS